MSFWTPRAVKPSLGNATRPIAGRQQTSEWPNGVGYGPTHASALRTVPTALDTCRRQHCGWPLRKSRVLVAPGALPHVLAGIADELQEVVPAACYRPRPYRLLSRCLAGLDVFFGHRQEGGEVIQLPRHWSVVGLPYGRCCVLAQEGEMDSLSTSFQAGRGPRSGLPLATTTPGHAAARGLRRG